MERKVGDVIEYDGQKFQIIEGNCVDCFFIDKSFEDCEEIIEKFGYCEIETPTYLIDICFKLVEQ